MALIPNHIIAEIRERSDLVAIIGEHVQLRRAGANYQGLCPFHQEKSPSFTVSPAKGFFYCFGCHKTGDVFRFLVDITGRSFVDVAQELAGRAGVVIPEPTPEERAAARGRGGAGGGPPPRGADQAMELRRLLLRVNELATRYFEAELGRSERAKQYLAERGVSAEQSARFRLGYAPDGWDGLLRLFAHKGVPHELAEQAGLLIRREGAATLPARAPATSAAYYDRFRERIMFPLLVPAGGGRLQTTLGDVVAFGGRVMPSDKPAGDSKVGAKYINSPETPLYRKGDHLYGLHAARDAIRKRRQVIIVEGNFDVIALHQAGFDNTVAPMGTALTEAQARLLGRLLGEDGHVVLMLDGDRAGRAATLKDIFLFTDASLRDVTVLSHRDLDVRVARLPDGEDPDTFAKANPEGLERVVKAARPAVDYVVDEAIAHAEIGSVGGRARVLERVSPLLLAIRSRTAQQLHIDRIASALGVRSDLILDVLRRQSPNLAADQLPPPELQPPRGSGPSGGARFPDRPWRPSGPREGSAAQPGAAGYGPSSRGASSYGSPSYGPPSHDPSSYGPPSYGGERGRPGGARGGAGRPPFAGGAPVSTAAFAPGRDPQRAQAPREGARAASGPKPWDALSLRLLLLLCNHPTLLPYVEDAALDAMDDSVLPEMIRQARQELAEDQPVNAERLLSLAPEEERAEVAAAVFSGKSLPSENPEQALAQLSTQIRDRAIQREIRDLTQRLARLTSSSDVEARLPINQRIRELILLREQIRGLSPVVDSPAP